jgi:hypothetical protein
MVTVKELISQTRKEMTYQEYVQLIRMTKNPRAYKQTKKNKRQ